MLTLPRRGLSHLQTRTTGVIRSAADPACRPLKTEGLGFKVANNLTLGVTAELDGLHRIQFRHGDGPEKQRSLDLPLSTSTQHLDPARRPFPVSNDLQWSSTQYPSSIPAVEWFVRNHTQSLKLVCPYKFGASPSPGRGVFKMITNSLRHYSEAPSFSFYSNSFVESSLTLPTEGHYNFATHYSSVNIGSMTLLVIKGWSGIMLH